MRRMILVASTFIAVAFLTVSSAQAQPTEASATISPATSGRGHGLGVGAMSMLNGFDGALVTWGSGGFHADGFFGLRHYSPNNNNNTSTAFSVGGRFWYHVHAAQFADFSLGGGLGLWHWNTNPGNPNNDSRLDLALEVGGQIRAFIVPNVALLADLGLGVTFSQTDDLLIGAQSVGGGRFVAGTLGIAYFFE